MSKNTDNFLFVNLFLLKYIVINSTSIYSFIKNKIRWNNYKIQQKNSYYYIYLVISIIHFM